jgi:hypothetical protein
VVPPEERFCFAHRTALEQSNNRVYELGEANRTTEFTSSAKPIEQPSLRARRSQSK